jgi:hypothetical protein
MEWQPIDTAPRDGTEVLLFIPNAEPRIRIGHYVVTQKFTYDEHGKKVGPITYWFSYERSVRLRLDIHPSHWMPLPEPPNLRGPMKR